MGGIKEDTEIIAVMGPTGSGKTTFINLVSNSNLTTSAGLRSCTEAVVATAPFDLDGRKVVMIDTPGFDDTTRSDSDILRLIADFLATSYKQGHKLAGILYFYKICDGRLGGVSLKNFRTFRKLCGEETLRNVVFVTNMWGLVAPPQLGAQREQELRTADDFGFKSALEKGARMMRHDRGTQSAMDILRYILGNTNPMALQIQREIVDQRIDVLQTAAAVEIEREAQAAREAERQRQAAEAERERLRLQEEARAREAAAAIQRQEAERIRQAELYRIQAEARRAQEERERQARELEQQMRAQAEARRIEAEAIQRAHQLALAEQQRLAAEEARRRQIEEEHLRQLALQPPPRRKKRRGLFRW